MQALAKGGRGEHQRVTDGCPDLVRIRGSQNITITFVDLKGEVQPRERVASSVPMRRGSRGGEDVTPFIIISLWIPPETVELKRIVALASVIPQPESSLYTPTLGLAETCQYCTLNGSWSGVLVLHKS